MILLIACGCSINENKMVKISQESQTLVAHGRSVKEEKGEPYQFPEAGKTIDGSVYVTCSGLEHQDTSQGYETERYCYVSEDQGESWTQMPASDLIKGDIKLSNGRYFQGVIPQNSYTAEWIKNYTPAYCDETLQYYYAKDIAEFEQTMTFREYDQETGVMNEFEGSFDWEYMPVVVENDRILPMNAIGYLAQFYAYKDTLYMTLSSYGFDHESGGGVTNRQSNIYIFESRDSARSWTYVSQILAMDNDEIKESDGYSEPNLVYDGNQFLIVLRTGTALPCYISRTKDPHKWMQPYKFQEIGVKPQLLLLENDILVAAYGRPGIFVRASRDKDKVSWCDPYVIDDRASFDEPWKYSCSYTSMVPLSKNELLIFYSDFMYPVDGKEVKAILCKKLMIQ